MKHVWKYFVNLHPNSIGNKTLIMKKTDYEKPITEVIYIQEHIQLLVGSSDLTGSREDYGEAVETEWAP